MLAVREADNICIEKIYKHNLHIAPSKQAIRSLSTFLFLQVGI